ncbi:ATP-binding protein [Streptomyces sp. DSM 42041]|uniref:ATP-binding protein n=1 Tax=Streptomyces hazeniae TaxID=3075538 RepID=A0ABU2NVK7_9ACTN|nr:ATP-binding protein [Streptomyces sp. DSM 42041]MDT0381011.1 ATP-binding protein [Streptomyces sp. DSM 42041]
MNDATERREGYTPHPYVGGRDAVLRLLAEWGAARPEVPRNVVLTGTPGTGRTRLIAGFVALCDDELRRRLPLDEMDPALVPPVPPVPPLLPQPGRLTVEDFPLMVASALGLETLSEGEAGMEELGAALNASSEPVTIVVPEIERADRRAARGAERLVNDVLNPLARTENVRLLLDLPRDFVHPLTRDLADDAVLVLDLDHPQWWETEGLAAQVEAALDPRSGAPELPFSRDSTARAAVAQAIAGRAGNNVLVMDLVVRSLFAAPEGFDAADHGALPRTVDEALTWHAERVGLDPGTLRTALTPLALSTADELPESLWCRLLAALDDRCDASALLGSPALEPFVSVRRESGRRAARLALTHGAIGTTVRSGIEDIRDRQARIAVSLLEAVPDQQWGRADPYVRDHIADHTLEAGLLPQLLTDPALFVHADPVRLLAAVSEVPAELLGSPARTYLRIAPLLAGNGVSVPVRAALLDMAFVQDGLHEYGHAVRRLGIDLPWQTLWSLHLPCVRGVSAATLTPPEDPDGRTPGLPAPAAALVVPAGTAGALPLEEGSEVGLLVHDLNRPALLDDAELDRLTLASGEARAAAPLALDPRPQAIEIWDRVEGRVVTTFPTEQSLVDVDLSPEGVLLVATESSVTAVSIRRGPSLAPL